MYVRNDINRNYVLFFYLSCNAYKESKNHLYRTKKKIIYSTCCAIFFTKKYNLIVNQIVYCYLCYFNIEKSRETKIRFISSSSESNLSTNIIGANIYINRISIE